MTVETVPASGEAGEHPLARRQFAIIVDNLLPSFEHKNLGHFANELISRGYAVTFVTNRTSENETIDSLGEARVVKLGRDRSHDLIQTRELCVWLLRHRSSVWGLWAYRRRPYVPMAFLIGRLRGMKLTLKLDSAGGATGLTRSFTRRFRSRAQQEKRNNADSAGHQERLPGRTRPRPYVAALLQDLKRWWLVDLPVLFAHAVLAETESLADSIREHFPRAHVFHYPNALPASLRSTRNDLTSSHPKQKVLLSVGRIYPIKGFHTIMRAFAQAAESVSGWELRIVGPPEDASYCESLLGLQTDLAGAGRSIKILPEATGVALYRHFAEASIFALGSTQEGQPNVIVEAMLFGCAVVSTRVGSVGYLLDEGNCGVLVQPANVAELAVVLQDLMTDDQLRNDLQDKARRRCEALFSLDVTLPPVLGELLHE